MSEGYYEVAQICRNGHVINAYAQSQPEHNKKYCDKCGAPTMMSCEQCGTEIRGKYVSPHVLSTSRLTAPKYCHNCGSAYPWTKTQLEVARELVEEFEELDEAEKEQLKESLPDILSETPKTELAGRQWRRSLSKLGKGAYEEMRSFLIDLLSETAKKIIYP